MAADELHAPAIVIVLVEWEMVGVVDWLDDVVGGASVVHPSLTSAGRQLVTIAIVIKTPP